jgi:hypothetical protein
MATYPDGIPALPPLASGIDDEPAPAILQGDLVQGGHVTAAMIQHQNRKVLRARIPQWVTEDEILASKHRKYHVQGVNFDPAGVPHWALAIQQTLQNVQQTVDNVQQTVHNVQQQTNDIQDQQQEQQQHLERMNREIQQERQRSMNRSRKINEQPIEMLVRVDDGQMPDQQDPPVWFPIDQNNLMNATSNQLSALLIFYGQGPAIHKQDKQNQLKRFLGVTL